VNALSRASARGANGTYGAKDLADLLRPQVRLLTTTFVTGVSFMDHEFATGPADPL
jgi:hypothetical protein